jgi:hypothetical protein
MKVFVFLGTTPNFYELREEIYNIPAKSTTLLTGRSSQFSPVRNNYLIHDAMREGLADGFGPFVGEVEINGVFVCEAVDPAPVGQGYEKGYKSLLRVNRDTSHLILINRK